MNYADFTIRSKKEWDGYIEKTLMHEFFHTWYYHSLNTEGEPLLFVYEETDFFIAMPLIKRPIKNSLYYDLTSAYGYCGPISNIDLGKLPEITKSIFKSEFVNFMRQENAVCVFSRLHPFLNQCCIFQHDSYLKENGTTLYLDLSLSLEEQRSKYDKRVARQIRKLRKRAYIIKEGDSPEEIRKFTEMYHKNMDRVNASKAYYFDEKYFADILNVHESKNKLLLIYDGSELICGALLFLSNNIIRNHLSATSPKYLKESPSKLLVDEISIIGRRLGKKIFHLGGGVGGREDSLFKFKRLFTDLKIRDWIWCYINDTVVYKDLVLKSGAITNSESNYFPRYRQPPK